MILCLEFLGAGVNWWKDKWGKDLLNCEYYDIYKVRSDGPTESWWNLTVNRLWTWQAIRSRKLPNSKQMILEGGRHHLERIGEIYSKILSSGNSEPAITDVSWGDISSLFRIALDIKRHGTNVPTAVFASKMCHFLFPKIFPVMDNLATGVFNYEFYWRGMKDEWDRLAQKSDAESLVRNSIESSEKIHDRYPFETKIIELSHIGYKNGPWPPASDS